MVIENLQTIYEVGKGYAEQALDALESLADEEEVVDELADTEIIAQTDERIERDMQADAEETDDDIDKLDPRITEQNSPELADHDVLEEIVTIAPRPRRMRFNES